MNDLKNLMLFGVFLGCTTCCCMSWPSYYRTHQIQDPIVPLMSNGYDDEEIQWDLAQEPTPYDANEFDDDYYILDPYQKQQADSEIYKFTNFLEDLYKTNLVEPIYGEIVNKKPETEIELEQLKELGNIEKRKISTISPKNESPVELHSTTPSEKSSISGKLANPKITESNGQKEYPLLRPATPVKMASQEESSPVIVTQRSDKKPSPYDTLRKYLSIEDSLKKEAEKRRNADGRKHVKRSFVAETESLTNQLNKLKHSPIPKA